MFLFFYAINIVIMDQQSYLLTTNLKFLAPNRPFREPIIGSFLVAALLLLPASLKGTVCLKK